MIFLALALGLQRVPQGVVKAGNLHILGKHVLSLLLQGRRPMAAAACPVVGVDLWPARAREGVKGGCNGTDAGPHPTQVR
ncbi:hypothetical protein NH8B_1413 [Pseudogulbenkiania sp. NH8B]|nr:hypothetical protein NH8B_1413 [Pseudogulbenkiania sp. NH8B]